MLDTAQAYGLDFLFPAGDTTVGASLKKHGEFARPELDLLLAYATEESGTMVDVGANLGAIALPFAKARPGWTVVALEAHRGLCNVLAANTLNNRLYNVEPVHAAAGPETRFVNFPAPPLSQSGNYGTMSLHRVAGPVEPTRMFRLDEVAPRKTALVKIDVEGFDSEVLKGAERLLAARSTVWIVEASDQNSEAKGTVLDQFLEAGYDLYWFFAPFVTPASSTAPVEQPWMGDVNVLAVPRGGPNLWDLPPIASRTDRRPTESSAYGYLGRYGY